MGIGNDIGNDLLFILALVDVPDDGNVHLNVGR